MKNNGPIKGKENLHNEIEVEEIYPDDEELLRQEQERYQERKTKFCQKILGELEVFTECDANKWGEKEEYMLIDITSLIDYSIKTHLDNNQ